jgi:HK97 family phage major capsid protein
MAKSDLIYRFSEVDKTKVDRAARRVPMTFSSEYPALQINDRENKILRDAGLKDGELYVEILDHTRANVDLSMLKNHGAFLDEHDEKDQIGGIESIEVDEPEKVTRGTVILDKHEKAEIRLGQMENFSRPHVSAGYKYTRFLGKEKLPNGRDAYRFAWKGLEISSVAVPADPNIGVARAYKDLPEIDSTTKLNGESHQQQHNSMSENTAPVIDEKKRSEIELGAVSKFKDTAKKIRASAESVAKGYQSSEVTAKLRSLADEAIERGDTVEQFNSTLLENLPDVRKLDEKSADIGMGDKDVAGFSVMRAIRSCMDNKGKLTNDCPEFDINQECEKKYERRAGSFWIPADVVNRSGTHYIPGGMRDKKQRDLQVNVFGQGGAFVPTLLETTPIEILRNKMVLRELGIRIMAGLTGNVAIPRQTGAATAYSLGEIATATLSTQTIDQIAMNPKRVAVTNNYSKQLLIQSAVDVENFMRSDMMEVGAIKADYLGLNGTGGNSEPTGIINTPGVGSVVFGGAATFAKLVSFETALAVLNADRGGMAYVTSPAVRGTLKSTAKLLTGATTVAAVALWENDEVNGHPGFATNQVLNNQVLFGNWQDFIMGLFGGVDVVVDPYTLAKNAEVAITTNLFLDFACRHAQSFCVSADAGNQ